MLSNVSSKKHRPEEKMQDKYEILCYYKELKFLYNYGHLSNELEGVC